MDIIDIGINLYRILTVFVISLFLYLFFHTYLNYLINEKKEICNIEFKSIKTKKDGPDDKKN